MKAAKQPSPHEQMIAAMIVKLARGYPNTKLSTENVNAYVDALKDQTLDNLKTAFEECAATAEFFPSLAKIHKALFALTSPLANVPTGADAWAEVLHCVERYGVHNQRPKFSDPLIERAVDAFGWRVLCCSTYDDHVAQRAQFIRIYDSLLAREVEDTRLEPLRRQLREGQPKQPDLLQPPTAGGWKKVG